MLLDTLVSIKIPFFSKILATCRGPESIKIPYSIFSICLINVGQSTGSIFLYPSLQSAFVSNIYINTIILVSLLFGIGFCVFYLSQLQSNYSSLAGFNVHKSPELIINKSGPLKNLDKELIQITTQLIDLSNKTFFVNPKINRLIGKLKSSINKAISYFEQKQISNGKKEQHIILNNILQFRF